MNKPSIKALEKLLLSSAGQQPSSVGRLQDYRLIDVEGSFWFQNNFQKFSRRFLFFWKLGMFSV